MFEQLLQTRSPIILDGGLATELESQGIQIDTELWSAAILKSDPQAIINVHRAYLDAGAQCIVSASYQASRSGFMSLGLTASEADQLIVSSVALAMRAREEFLAANPDVAVIPLVAASVGPYGATLHDGSEYTGKYDLDEAGLRDFHRDRLMLLDRSGADVLACETIPSLVEAKALARLLEDVARPAWISFTCRDSKHLSDGTPLREAASLFREHGKVFAVGVNCTAPDLILPLIGELKQAVPDKAIVVYPNSGEQYRAQDNSWHGFAAPGECAESALEWHEAGAKLIGGCCRTGPEHIRAIRQKIAG
jgi:homocysteine S-methyltransferase